MRAGAYTEQIEILRRITHTNEYGDDVDTWETIIKTRASKRYMGGDVENRSGEEFFTRKLTFTVHQYIDVTEEDRILYKNQKYKIRSMENLDDTRNMHKVLTVELINE